MLRGHLAVAHLEPGVGHVEHRAPADLALHADRVVVALRRRGVALDAEHVARTIRERALRAGRQQRVHRPVDDARRVLRRWVARHRVQAVRVDVGVVVQPDARVQRRLRVAGEVPGQADARLRLDALIVAESLRVVGVSVARPCRCSDRPCRARTCRRRRWGGSCRSPDRARR